jgi:hypothetical protein
LPLHPKRRAAREAKTKLSEKERERALAQSRSAIVKPTTAPANPLPEDPDSLLSKTATVLNEQEALRAVNFNTINLEELEERIGLAARIVIEHYLRSAKLSPKDKCDIALRAVSTFEGSKQEVVWRDKRMRAPSKTTLLALRKEKEAITQKLLNAATRNKEIEVADAEVAVAELERQSAVEKSKPEDVN